MVTVKKDIQKNRLYITLAGILSFEDAKRAKELIEIEVNELKPDFDLVNDISKFIRGDDNAGIILKEIMVLLIQKKVNRIVRIVGASKAGLIQFANNSLPIDSYRLSYLPTMEEAENFLNQ